MIPPQIAHPEWLDPLALVGLATGLALAVAHLVARRRRRSLLGRDARLLALTLTSDASLFFALVCIGAGLLGPRLGERVVSFPSLGVDVVFLVDVSRSMDVRDVPPSRLARARRAVEEILGRLDPQDRAALAAFGARGVLLAPLTPDRTALLELLSGLDTELVEPASSHLGDGVRTALKAFEGGSQRPRVVFVLGDGEDPERGRDLGAAAAARAEARVITAALGTERGGNVPDRGALLRYRDGEPVVSRRNRERLAALAAATDGESFVGDEWGSFHFDRAAAAIRRDAAGLPGELVERRVRTPRVVPFAAAAFALLLFEGLPRPRRGRRAERGAVLGVFALAASLLASAAPLSGAARGADPAPAGGERPLGGFEAGDARSLLQLGLARLERGRSEAAARAFLAAAVTARSPDIAALAYYDLGVAALEQGDLKSARDAFFDSLALDPSDREARFNLEWTLQALRRRPLAIAESEAQETAAEADPEKAERERATSRRAEAAKTAREASRAVAASTPSREQRRRWLDRAPDDPTRALRSAARRRGGGESRGSAEPAW